MERKDLIITYAEAEKLAESFSKHLEEKLIFIRVNNTGWRINYPEFTTKEPGDPF